MLTWPGAVGVEDDGARLIQTVTNRNAWVEFFSLKCVLVFDSTCGAVSGVHALAVIEEGAFEAVVP